MSVCLCMWCVHACVHICVDVCAYVYSYIYIYEITYITKFLELSPMPKSHENTDQCVMYLLH